MHCATWVGALPWRQFACRGSSLTRPRTADARRMQRVFGVRSAWILAGERQVPIKRDQHGVPHVYAQTEADLYRGIGNCHGTDRGLQMTLTRILGQGRASEIL